MCPTIIMAAPNGARKVKTDHPGIPVSIEETVAEAKSCFSAGASILHAHVRDDEGKHVLDTSLYRKLLNALSIEVPNMLVQVTTESVGIYSPEEQASLVYELKPDFISVGFREMIGDNSIGARRHAQDFYHQAHRTGIHIQHILYVLQILDDSGKRLPQVFCRKVGSTCF